MFIFRCWIGGSGSLMYIIFYMPIIGGVVATAGFLFIAGSMVNKTELYTAKTEDPFIRDIQVN